MSNLQHKSDGKENLRKANWKPAPRCVKAQSENKLPLKEPRCFVDSYYGGPQRAPATCCNHKQGAQSSSSDSLRSLTTAAKILFNPPGTTFTNRCCWTINSWVKQENLFMTERSGSYLITFQIVRTKCNKVGEATSARAGCKKTVNNGIILICCSPS